MYFSTYVMLMHIESLIRHMCANVTYWIPFISNPFQQANLESIKNYGIFVYVSFNAATIDGTFLALLRTNTPCVWIIVHWTLIYSYFVCVCGNCSTNYQVDHIFIWVILTITKEKYCNLVMRTFCPPKIKYLECKIN